MYLCEMLCEKTLLLWGKYFRNSDSGCPWSHMFRVVFANSVYRYPCVYLLGVLLCQNAFPNPDIFWNRSMSTKWYMRIHVFCGEGIFETRILDFQELICSWSFFQTRSPDIHVFSFSGSWFSKMHCAILVFSGIDVCVRNAVWECISVVGEVFSTLGLGISMVLYVSGRFCKLGFPLCICLFFVWVLISKNAFSNPKMF